MTCVQHWPRLRTSLISKWPVSCERTPRSGFWFLGPQGWCMMMCMRDSDGWYMYVCVIYVAMVNHGDYGWLWWFTTGIVMFFMKGQGCWCRTEADQTFRVITNWHAFRHWKTVGKKVGKRLGNWGNTKFSLPSQCSHLGLEIFLDHLEFPGEPSTQDQAIASEHAGDLGQLVTVGRIRKRINLR